MSVALRHSQLTRWPDVVVELARGGPLRRAATLGTMFVVFALPWSDAITTLDKITKPLSILVALVAVLAVLAEGRQRRLAEPQLLGLGFLGLALVSVIWSISDPDTYDLFLPIVQITAILLLAWEFCPERRGAVVLARAYALGCGVAVTATIATSLLGGVIEDNRLEVGDAQPNDLAYAISLGIPIAFYLSRLARTRLRAGLYGLLIPASLYSVVLLASRSALVVSLIGVLIIPWALVTGSRVRLRLLMVAAILAVPLVPQLLPAEQVARLSTTAGELSGSTLNGRSELWSAAWAILGEHPIVGVGAGASRVEIQARTDVDLRAHNTPLSIGAELGSVGLVVSGLLALAIAHRALTTTGLEHKLVVVLGLLLIVGLQVRHWEYQPNLWGVLVILIGLGGPAGSSSGDPGPYARGLPPNDADVRGHR